MGAGATTSTGRRRRPVGELPRSYATEVDGRRTMPAGTVLLVVLIALLLGGLLNVRSLAEAAQRQPPGFKRDASLVLVWPFQQVSELLGLDQPRRLLAERLGRLPDAGFEGGGGATGGEAAGEGPGDALAAAAALAGREAVDLSLGTTPAVPAVDPDQAALAPPLPSRLVGPFTPEDPLQVAVIGDSLTEQVGPSLIARLGRPGVPAQATHDFTYSSGLSRPDFYDWPARAAQLAQTLDPDIWVVMVGANDGQDVIDEDGRFRQIGSEEWEAIYRERVAALMDQLITDGRAAIWIGQPIMRDVEFDETIRYLNAIYAEEAADRAFVSFVDARQVFADAEGRYADYLPAGDGQLTQMRLSDGIHLTRAGAERLVSQVLPLLPVETSPTPSGQD